ncbi:MAG: helix-turn-helix transcriptional regulator [Methylomicrobium sp.]
MTRDTSHFQNHTETAATAIDKFPKAPAAPRIIRMHEAKLKTGLSRSTIYKLESEGKFPPKIKLSERTVGFLEPAIDAWIAERVAASSQGGAA